MRSRVIAISLFLLAAGCSTGGTVGSSVTRTSAPHVSGPSPTTMGRLQAAPCVRSLSDFQVSYWRAGGIPRSAEALARRGTSLAVRAFDARIPSCEDRHVAVRLLPLSNSRYDALTRVAPTRFTIVIAARSEGWLGVPRSDRLITVLHEWYHVLQFALDSSCRCHTPNWLVEGSAVYESYRAAATSGIADYGDLRRGDLFFASSDETPISSLAKSPLTAPDYSVAFLAVELLVRLTRERALDRYWVDLAKMGAARSAFEDAFRMTPERFDALFGRYRRRNYAA